MLQLHWKPILFEDGGGEVQKHFTFPEPQDININMMPFLVDHGADYPTILSLIKYGI